MLKFKINEKLHFAFEIARRRARGKNLCIDENLIKVKNTASSAGALSLAIRFFWDRSKEESIESSVSRAYYAISTFSHATSFLLVSAPSCRSQFSSSFFANGNILVVRSNIDVFSSFLVCTVLPNAICFFQILSAIVRRCAKCSSPTIKCINIESTCRNIRFLC